MEHHTTSIKGLECKRENCCVTCGEKVGGRIVLSSGLIKLDFVVHVAFTPRTSMNLAM
jgi:hypothetical protein